MRRLTLLQVLVGLVARGKLLVHRLRKAVDLIEAMALCLVKKLYFILIAIHGSINIITGIVNVSSNIVKGKLGIPTAWNNDNSLDSPDFAAILHVSD